MERYRNINGDSGVYEYEFGNDYIRVQFSTSAQYIYTYQSAGVDNIEHMKILAVRGSGLNAFINKVVRNRYARKER